MDLGNIDCEKTIMKMPTEQEIADDLVLRRWLRFEKMPGLES